jgi:hypothetical protein
VAAFYNNLRLPGFFGFNKSEYEREKVRYTNGREAWVKDEQNQKFTYKSRLLPAFILNILRTDIMQADRILITDYNSTNPNSHILREVAADSNFEPRWIEGALLAAVDIDFKPGYNNFKRRRF